MTVDMDKIMQASLGESSSTIRATFKKTVNVRQYETEQYEISSTLDIPGNISGPERELITAVLEAQLEHSAYLNMYGRGFVTGTQYNDRMSQIVTTINQIKDKAEKLTNKNLDSLFNALSSEASAQASEQADTSGN